MAHKIPTRLYLAEDEIPRHWYNLRADMTEKPDPILHPGTLLPATAADLEPVFCQEPEVPVIEQVHQQFPV